MLKEEAAWKVPITPSKMRWQPAPGAFGGGGGDGELRAAVRATGLGKGS